MTKPDFLFEISWEVCNKVGGIHTVIASKAFTLQQKLQDNYILIGPGIWQDTQGNNEFEEDTELLKTWRIQATSEGLEIKIGRWNIPGKPIVILIDFSMYFNMKDVIFTEFWEKYKLDSLSGGWDYIEPVMFGYAAGKIIESYYHYFVSSQHTIAAHFHEWMTGSGILYLKDRTPQISTVFTTHATVLGRSIAGNNLPLYSDLNNFDPTIISEHFNVKAKQSLEKIAADQADAFTTVSGITNEECKHFLSKAVDVITPNGFEDSFVPDEKSYLSFRHKSRKKLISITQAIINQPIPEDAFFISISGRYELKNKGIDIFIDALNALENISRTIVAFILVPAGHAGPRLEIMERLHSKNFDNPITSCYLTHYLHSRDSDPIVQKLFQSKLNNGPNKNVKLIFAPVYLNGQDGIINIPYYELLPAFDLTIYPSYYEPWGYTPLESIAFGIPTVTTTLAGFSHWVKTLSDIENKSVMIIERTDFNDEEVTNNITQIILNFLQKDENEKKIIADNAVQIARKALWNELIDYYFDAFDIAIKKSKERYFAYASKSIVQCIKAEKHNAPKWKKILVKSKLPEKLKALHEIAGNVWWSWNDDAFRLFESVDKELWNQCNQNPINLLELIDFENLKELEHDTEFLKQLEQVYLRFTAYLNERTTKKGNTIAYFSMEYGLHHTIRIYSGGLGILAGDYLKQASDENRNFVGIGLLYRYGYFEQEISPLGEQIESYTPQKLSHLPVIPLRNERNDWVKINIPFPGRMLTAKVWQLNVGSIPLYLMDTDIEENNETDKKLTHNLYGGNREYRIQQEILLGIGGVLLLRALRINPTIFHLNEGHAAFIHLERLNQLLNIEKLPFIQAFELIRSSSLFTTHTPVPAGHDTFTEDMLRKYLGHYVENMNLSWDTFLGWGKINEDNINELFSMSILAAKFSQEINGVSQIHGSVTRKMFAPIWKNYFPNEINIGYVTNGVHFDTWVAPEWKNLYAKTFNADSLTQQTNMVSWDAIKNVMDQDIVQIKNTLRKKLIDTIKEKLLFDLKQKKTGLAKIWDIINKLDENTLTIGFARRFATYKRAHLLFENREKLYALVNNPERPVQFIFSGKAHPADQAGKDIIKKIYEFSLEDDFAGRIIFIEDYNMQFAKILISGVDVWMNTPTRPMEASGTSGEKAVMNGVPNLSVMDGWWAEGYVKGAGWNLDIEKMFQNQSLQDQYDAEILYNLIDKEIAPAFYSDENKWVSHIKNTIAQIAPRFTTRRMMNDYFENFYDKLIARTHQLTLKDYDKLKSLVIWKNGILSNWDSIELVVLEIPDPNQEPLSLGETFNVYVKLKVKGIEPKDIGIEIVFGKKEKDTVIELINRHEFIFINQDNNLVDYECTLPASKAGVYDYAIRIFPKNDLMAHRYEMDLVKWF